MRGGRRVQRALPAAVLSALLVLGLVWAASFGVARAGEDRSAERPAAVAVAALLPQSVTPVRPETRLVAKHTPGVLPLLVAAVAALLLGFARRVRWPAAAGAGASASPAVGPGAVRGRAPPRRTA